MAFVPSKQQADFFNWIKEGNGSCVLEAVAGAGKTSTLIEALNIMEGFIFFGAYNKKIADEIKEKAPVKNGLTIGTMHSAGFSMWRKVAGNVTVDSNKCRNIYRSTFTEYNDRELESPVINLVSYAKQAGVGILVANEDSSYFNLIDHYDVDCLDKDVEVVSKAKIVLEESIKQDVKVIDFDDMIFAPLIHHVKPFQYDWVLVDEAQDTNATRRALALLMLKRSGRLVAVGDRHQAIYGFTGADSDALDLIRNATDAIEMPLTVTYRCPKNVVAEANKYVSHINAHETAPEGTVTVLTSDVVSSAKPNDAILCRYNAPIINLVYKFIAEGIPAKVEGREIGTNLKALARRYKSKTFSTLIDRLNDYRDRESAKYRVKEKENMAIAIEDKVSCLIVIINRVEKINAKSSTPVDDVCAEIDKIFGDDVKGCVILSSIHKSKGREWDNVYWLQAKENRFAVQSWQKTQEKNLKYVAVTRAKKNLFIIPFKKEEEK